MWKLQPQFPKRTRGRGQLQPKVRLSDGTVAIRTRVTAKVREGRRSQQCEPMKALSTIFFPSLVTHEFGWINGERSQRGNRGRGDAQERHRYHGAKHDHGIARIRPVDNLGE